MTFESGQQTATLPGAVSGPLTVSATDISTVVPTSGCVVAGTSAGLSTAPLSPAVPVTPPVAGALMLPPVALAPPVPLLPPLPLPPLPPVFSTAGGGSNADSAVSRHPEIDMAPAVAITRAARA